MRENLLRDTVGAVSGYVCDCYSARLCALQVHIIVPSCENPDILQVGEGVNLLLKHRNLICENGDCAGGALYDFILWGSVVGFDFSEDF